VVEVSFDACVVGGGPAGSATAIRLAKLGHRVCLVERSRFPRSHVGESVTSGIWPIVEVLGLGDSLKERFLVPGETLIRWSETYVERLASDGRTHGLLVDRGRFDTLLLQAAMRAGVQVFEPAQVREVSHNRFGWQFQIVTKTDSQSVTAKFLVDAAGRAGFLPQKRKQVSPRTLALCGYLPSERCPTATLVEALPDGWCWGAPIPGGVFSTMVFLDRDSLWPLRRDRLESGWRSELAKAELFSALSDLPLVGRLISCDATTYFAEDPICEDLIRVGESSLALDPLSSSGVEKAMHSGLVAATAVHTMLLRPDRRELCARFYRERQTETLSSHASWSSDFYRRVERFAELPFWEKRMRRSEFEHAEQNPLVPSLEHASLTLTSKVRISAKATLVREACIVGDEICSRPALSHPSLGRPVAFVEGVELGLLLEMVRWSSDLGRLLLLWSNRVSPHQALRIATWLLTEQILEPVS
jgi:flavin-dependent dehydrogenase